MFRAPLVILVLAGWAVSPPAVSAAALNQQDDADQQYTALERAINPSGRTSRGRIPPAGSRRGSSNWPASTSTARSGSRQSAGCSDSDAVT